MAVNASPALFFTRRAASRRSPLLLELASVGEVLVNGSPSLFCLCRAERGARRTLDAASGTGFDPRKTCAGETKKP
jgi:hypothetical protein